MKLMRFFLLSVALFFGLTALQAQPSQVKWQTKVEHISADSYRVKFIADIEKSWHMYDMQNYDGGPNPTVFTFETQAGLELDGKVTSIEKPIRHFDEMFGMEIGYYEGKVTFVQKVKLSAPKAVLKANVEWMVCNDQNCAPPTDEDFEVEIVAVAKPAAVVTPAATVEPKKENSAPAAEVVKQPEVTDPADVVEVVNPEPEMVTAVDEAVEDNSLTVAPVDEEQRGSTSLWGLIIEAILWGFAALLTPCVFPMVPMTVSFFMKGSGSPAKGRFRASMYGFFIVALYTLPIAILILVTRWLGGDSVTTDIFNWLATHWLPNIIFFLVFMIFAASFFGAFEITMPSKLVNKTDDKATGNGLGGIFFMALTLVLVSFSCTGPIVGSVIIKSMSGGDFWEPVITMFAFSAAFALPFTLFAFFPSMLKNMPKSGGWLNSVKVVLGFVELALGLKFLSVADQTYHWGLLDREVYLAIWIVVFTLLGFYLLGKIKFAHDSEVKHVGVGRLGLAILVFTFVVYLIPGMWGAPLRALSGYMPPIHTQDFVLTPGGGATNTDSNEGKLLTVDGKAPRFADILHLPHGLQGFFDLKEAEAYAAKVNKPIFIDFTGHGCVNCREMEARVWSDPEVLRLLNDEYVICALYVDDKTELPEDEWVTNDNGKVLKGIGRINAYYQYKRFNANAQPHYIIQGRNEEVLLPARSYDLSVPGFIEFLEKGIEAYKAQ